MSLEWNEGEDHGMCECKILETTINWWQNGIVTHQNKLCLYSTQVLSQATAFSWSWDGVGLLSSFVSLLIVWFPSLGFGCIIDCLVTGLVYGFLSLARMKVS